MNCYTKKVGWTVSQRRLDELLYKEGWMDCYTKIVGWTVSKRLYGLFHKEGSDRLIQGSCINCLYKAYTG